MTVKKGQCKVIGVRPQPQEYDELKKEANEKGLSVANYCEEILKNRHNLIKKENDDNCIYKATIEQYYHSGFHSIKDIKQQVNDTKENVFDGMDGFIHCKLISIEKLE